jgi:hypothetical protein
MEKELSDYQKKIINACIENKLTSTCLLCVYLYYKKFGSLFKEGILIPKKGYLIMNDRYTTMHFWVETSDKLIDPTLKINRILLPETKNVRYRHCNELDESYELLDQDDIVDMIAKERLEKGYENIVSGNIELYEKSINESETAKKVCETVLKEE